jgi:hypothetical protein
VRSSRALSPYASTEYARGVSANSTAMTQPSAPTTERLPRGFLNPDGSVVESLDIRVPDFAALDEAAARDRGTAV